MTLFFGTTRASSLASAGTSNNPIFAWNNRATRAGATYSSRPTADAAGPVENAFDGVTYDSCQLTLTGTSGNITVDLGTDIAISFCAVAAHNLGTAGGGAGAARPRYSTDNITYNNCDSITAQTIADDGTFAFYFDTITARYWQLTLSGFTASDVLNIGVLFFGNVVTMDQRIYQGYTPPITPTVVDMVPEMSEGGHILGTRVQRRYSTAEPQFSHLSASFISSAAWLNFQTAWNNGTPAFWSWRPTAFPDEIYYATRSGAPIVPTNSGPKALMSVSIPMQLYHEDW